VTALTSSKAFLISANVAFDCSTISVTLGETSVLVIVSPSRSSAAAGSPRSIATKLPPKTLDILMIAVSSFRTLTPLCSQRTVRTG